jgi:RecA-family ATPase
MIELEKISAKEMLAEIEKIGIASQAVEETSIGVLWGELKERAFTNTEQILFGIRRGNVGVLVAETEIGKTTLSLNLCLTLAANKTFPPFVDKQYSGRRIMYIDGEATQAELRDDISRMICEWTEGRELLDSNLLLLCDEELDEELLTLSNPSHLAAVKRKAQEFKPDLIIVDTMSALFTLHDENSNAEVKRVVMQPLKMLAKEANAGLMLAHHSGKSRSEEGGMKSHAYLGRGGSNFGCLARSVVTLRASNKSDKERVILSIPKAKGFRLADVVMQYDPETRWFKVTDERPVVRATCFEEVMAFVSQEQGASKAEIVEALESKYSSRAMEVALTEAIRSGRLVRPRQGFYALPGAAYPHSFIAESGIVEATENEEAVSWHSESAVDESTILADGNM